MKDVFRVGGIDADKLKTTAMDLRGEPTKVCICGSKVWNLQVMWDDDDTIGMYFMNMWCPLCDSVATAPIVENDNDADI
jgi:hypothetical protein